MASANSVGSDSRTGLASSPVWPIASKATAAVLGGFVVTYWVGAAFTKSMVLAGVLGKADAGLAGGLVQLVTYTGAVLWVSAMTSNKKTWIGLAGVTGLCIAIVMLTPDFPSPTGPAATSAAQAMRGS